jgi:hypothetical protein
LPRDDRGGVDIDAVDVRDSRKTQRCQDRFLLLRENADCLHDLLLIGNIIVPEYKQI